MYYAIKLICRVKIEKLKYLWKFRFVSENKIVRYTDYNHITCVFTNVDSVC